MWHSATVMSAGKEVMTGAVWSSTVRVWLHETELRQSSNAVQVRLTLLTAGQLAGSLSSTNVTSRFASQPSSKAGAPELGVAGHSMV